MIFDILLAASLLADGPTGGPTAPFPCRVGDVICTGFDPTPRPLPVPCPPSKPELCPVPDNGAHGLVKVG